MDRPNDVTITCANGVQPRLLELEQHSTYRGLLEGLPNHELNEQILENIISYQGRIPTHLVRPTERLLERDHESPYGPFVLMPERQCTGLFDVDGNWLNIVWFQDTWAPPIDSAVLEELRTLDFLTIAFDEVDTW
jgi:hypothetical protein